MGSMPAALGLEFVILDPIIGCGGILGLVASPPWVSTVPSMSSLSRDVLGVLEFDVPSYRTDVAQQRGQEQEVNRQN